MLSFDVQNFYQSRDALVRDASTKKLRESPQILDPSVEFQLSALRQKTPRCDQPQDQVSPHTASSPSVSQPPESCHCRYGPYDPTAEAPAYDTKELDHCSCQRATRLVKNHKPTNIRTRKSQLHRGRRKNAVSRPRDIRGRFLSRNEQAKISTRNPDAYEIATKGSSAISKGLTTAFYGEQGFEDMLKRYSTSCP